MPTVEQLQADVHFIKKQQKNYATTYQHLHFPMNALLPTDIKEKLDALGFFVTTLCVMIANKEALQLVHESDVSKQIKLVYLTENLLQDYLHDVAKEQSVYGTLYQEQMAAYIKAQLSDEHTEIILAYDEGKIVGELTILYCDEYLELDNFSVKEAYQGKGIGTKMQKMAVSCATDKQLIYLIAEKDSPAMTMYEKQGYQIKGWIETALRIE